MRHEGIKKFVCNECGKAFATTAELTTHNRTHTGLKPYDCSLCTKSYKTKSHLAVHFRMHTGSRPYACDLCPQKFAHNKVYLHASTIFEYFIFNALFFLGFETASLNTYG